ncbi:glycosyltransferase family 4 protein [Candidatus Methylopumilus universalis]|uniref:Glycosyltransferase family 4 protein n=1 Tax=Candidatus Methylopumilus universalis TaxID=2588536 RepID=A0AAX1EZT7_9PROT|nr:glycosyltransferase [Candidatus Methylopumilus universalis]QDC41242.1 glycosyltransferase family 4 protein [Candidatus Methylopumilus universalis]QDC42532.1 glycosyltransferase family 4 protein [Candidatus Methylopumilus universalis]QDC54918.1 glycosyltransferase family 4 protein [Candidatus Methylopumilus universalis]QDC56199.1 glycosyltransferase family 4 protein [Candidatus Methylopumilus universalis]QDC57481.1 glycosyltransferase family 4 protein [Candidatus Methylopumilus universalis]
MNKNNFSKLYINALNIYSDGGVRQLNDLLEAFDSKINVKVVANTDVKITTKIPSNVKIACVKSTIFSRFLLELWLFIKVSSRDQLLCFGNFPPVLKNKGKVYVFLQNRYLIDRCEINSKNFRFKVFLQRIFFKICASNDYFYIVQSPTMRELLNKKIPKLKRSGVFPFTNLKTKNINVNKNKSLNAIGKIKTYKFIYVASGEEHKNHKALIKAWALLAEEGIFPMLYLTVNKSKYPRLHSMIVENIKINNLRIINYGTISHKLILAMYKRVDALIYPSLFESFGLPLVESRFFNLPIIASELDYVRDFICPKETFDPRSPNSIANSVKRFMKLKQEDNAIYTPKQFVKNFFYD